jgi:succinoglycan biosynthesis protein ExoW
MIDIVVPFYQRSQGLLFRAVQSVLNQSTSVPWRIIVVDDGSPVDAEAELKPLRALAAERLTIVRQPNAGVAAARNRGLDCLNPQTEIVAFLDADDVWEKDHLARVVAAMQSGAEFFFENCQRFDEPGPRFSQVHLALDAASLLDKEQEIYWFDGDFFDVVFKRSPAITSTIAYKLSSVPQVRFRRDVWPCDDIYFWLEASLKVRRVGFSPKVGAFLGEGVNISRAKWGTVGEARRLMGNARFQALIEDNFDLTRAQKQWNAMMLRGLDSDFWRSTLAAAVRGEYRSVPLAASYLKMRPAAMKQIPLALMQMVKKKISPAGMVANT